MYFDTHAHLCLCNDFISIKKHLELCKEEKVSFILDAGLHPHDFENRQLLLKNHPQVLLGVGYGPSDITYFPKDDLHSLEVMVKKNKNIVAISEIGLEYFHYKDNWENQKKILSHQLDLAKAYDLPVFLHIREAYLQVYEILKASGVQKGAVHCFTGSEDEAFRFLDLNFYLSFSGIVTFKNALSLQDVVKKIPLDSILTETDAPYLAPVPKRGQKNIAPFIKYTNQFIAHLKNIEESILNKTIFNNAKKLIIKN